MTAINSSERGKTVAEKELSQYPSIGQIGSSTKLAVIEGGRNAQASAAVLEAFVGYQIDASGLPSEVDALKAAQQTSAIYAATLADLQALVGTYVNQGAFVANGAGAGQYRWNGAAWEFLRADILTQKADYNVVALTSGNVRGQAVPRAQAFNGASIATGGTGIVGFDVPSGSTGATTYISSDIPAAELRGKRVRVQQIYEASADWLSLTPLNAVHAQVTAGGATSTIAVADYSISQTGTRVVQVGTIDVPVNADRIGFTLQIASNAPSRPAPRSVRISEIGYSFISPPPGVETPNDEMLQLRLVPVNARASEAIAASAAAILTSGEMLDGAVPRGQTFNGATLIIGSNGLVKGLAIPEGLTGGSSFLTSDFDALAARSRRIRIVQKYAASLGWLAATPLTGVRAQALAGAASSNLVVTNYSIVQDAGVITLMGEVDVPFNADRVGLTIQVSPSAPAVASARSLEFSSLSYTLAVVAGGGTANDQMLDVRLDGVRASVGAFKTATLTAGAGGAYAKPGQASQAVVNRSVTNRSTILLGAGRYNDEFNWTLARYATLRARGAARPWIHYELPDDSLDAPANFQPFWVVYDGSLDGVKVTARNARYAVHCEASGANPDSKISVRDSWFEHFGNTLAGWVSQAAWGMGVSSGWDFRSEGTVYRSPFCAFSFHTNRDFTKPSHVENRNDRLIGTAVDGAVAGLAIRAQPLGSRQRDRHVLIGCEVVGDYFYNPSPWMPATLDYQPASHAEIEVSGYGNTPFVFRISDFGRALKVASAGGAGSSIAVSGTAAAVLFGDVSTFAGAANLPGYVHGSVDVSGAGVGPTNAVFITSLGNRLGDCSTVNKVLSVAVDGAAPLTVTFDQDYTNATNAAILAAINAVLGSAASATEYALGNRYRPNLRDEEKSLQNSSAVGIPMGSVLAYDGSYKRVRLMTAADAASLFAGIAWEDIYPSGWGRVKTSGYLPVSDIRRSDGAALVFGATMSVSATPGIAMSGGSQGLLRAIRPDAIEVGS